MKIIKCIGVLACLVLPFIGHAGDLESAAHGIVTNLLTSADLKTHFQSIEIGMTNVVLKYHAHGLRYKRTIDNGQPVINKYGEVVNLSIDHTMRMVSKGIVLMFDGVSNGNIKGFVISQRTDLRSLGGSVGIKRAFLVLEKNGESVSPEIVLENVESVLGGGTDVYSNGPVGGVPKSSHEVVRRCKELLKPMSDIVNGYSDVTAVTNKGVVCVNVSNDVRRCTLHYSLLSGGCPKMIVQRSPSGDGHDIYLDSKGRPTKYIEYKNNHINGLWVEYYTNSNVRAYMTLTNDCFSGKQFYFDEKAS